MRKLFVILFIIVTLPLSAQEVRTARVIKKPAEAEKPEPTPAPRRSIIDRWFGLGKPTPTPAPKPVVKPAPTKVKPKYTKPARPAVKPVSRPATKPKPTVEETPPAPTEQPKSPEAPVSTPPAPVENPPADPAVIPPPVKPETKPDMSGLDEAGKYKVAKEAALKDAAIIELKKKADTTIDAEAAKQATVNYNRALFKKIRAIEPSLDAYVDKLEAAVLKRVK